MVDKNDAEIFKITAVDDKGNEIVAYVKPEARHQYLQFMTSEYDSVTSEPMMLADLPDDVEVQ